MKPTKVYMQNPNVAYMDVTRDPDWQSTCETFFYCSLHCIHNVNATERSAMFVVDGKFYFDVKGTLPARDSIRPCAVGEIEIGKGNFIPLWMMGLLY